MNDTRPIAETPAPDSDMPNSDGKADAFPIVSEGGVPKLRGSRCTACGQACFPRRSICSACASRDMQDITLEDTGTLYSFSVVYVSSARPTPYAIGYVDLPNNVRVLTLLDGDALSLNVDMKVRLSVQGNDWFFVPAEGVTP